MKWYPLPLFNRYSRILQLIFNNIPKLLHIIAKEKIDIIHNHEIRRGLVSKVPAILKDVPNVTTIAGGTLPDILPARDEKLIVFSRELQEGFINKSGWNGNNIYVVANRIDTERFRPGKANSDLAEKLGICGKYRNVLVMSRFEYHGGKVEALLNILRAIPNIYDEIPDLKVSIAGHGSQQRLIETEVSKINRQMQKGVIKLVGTIHEPEGLFPIFDLAFGMGRTALESMSCGIPTLIIGSRGFGGVVCREQVDEIAYCNFSGRNAKENTDEKEVANTVIKILKNSETARELSAFSRQYILENYDIKDGASKVEKIYEKVMDSSPNRTSWQKTTDLMRWIYGIIVIYPYLLVRKTRRVFQLH